MEKVFYRCDICGNLVGLVADGGVPMICCGKPMSKLAANTTDAAQEKHVPALTVAGDRVHVQVGDIAHPMTPEHYIQWIMVTQNGKTQRQELTPADKPEADFCIEPGEPLACYEYCNLHGLWKKEL